MNTTVPSTWTKAEQKRAARASHRYGYFNRNGRILVKCRVCGAECEARRATLKELDAAVLYHFEVECGQDGI